jgi:hypothetical protein
MFDGLLRVDPAWAGKVQFYELVWGTWISYAFIVLLWERLLRWRLPEWKYAMLVFFGASAFWINHYFQYAPYWMTALNTYAFLFFVAWWWLGIRGAPRRWGWRLGALAGGLAYTIVFILAENIGRFGVERLGMHEFCFMTLAFFGWTWLIWWRGRARPTERAATA